MSTKISTKRDFSTLVPNDSKSSADANSAKRIRTGGLNTVKTDKNASPANSVISENDLSNTNPLLDGLVIPSVDPYHDSKSNVAILATYESETITRVAYGHKNGRVNVISWGSIENVKALIEDGLLSAPNPDIGYIGTTASNWKLIPNEFKDVLATTAIEKNPYVLEFFSEKQKNKLQNGVLVTAIQWDSLLYTHLSEQQKQDKNLVILCIDIGTDEPTEQSKIVEEIPIVFKNNIDVVLRLIRNYGQARMEWFHSDRTRFNGFRNPYEWCAPDLFSDPVFVMQAVKYDYGIMLHVMYHHTEIYERLQDNKPFVMLFIDIYTRQCLPEYEPNPLQYVSERLHRDPDVLNQVVHNAAEHCNYWVDTLVYAPKRLCESSQFVFGILEVLPIDDVDKNEVREMLATNCPFLACDIDFIISVIDMKGAEAILWFDEWFRKDKSAVKAIMEANPLVVEHVSADLQDNLDIIKPYFCECPSDEILEFASERVHDFVVSMKDLYVEYKEALRTRTDGSDGSDDHITVYNQIIAKHDAFIKEKM